MEKLHIIRGIQVSLSEYWQLGQGGIDSDTTNEKTIVLTYRKDNGEVTTREVVPLNLWRSSRGRLMLTVYDLRRDAPRSFAVENLVDGYQTENLARDMQPPQQRLVEYARKLLLDRWEMNLDGWKDEIGGVLGSASTVRFYSPFGKRWVTLLFSETTQSGEVVGTGKADDKGVTIFLTDLG